MDGGSTGNKFRKGLVGDVEKKISYEEGQKALREKYKLKEDVVVVEKNNIVKFLVRAAGAVIRILARILLIIFATIGLIALIYPETRAALMGVLTGIYQQVQMLLAAS